LLGPNGAGKTTLIGILAGLVVKSEGEVEVFGTSIDRDPVKVKSYIGLVPQEFNFNIFEKVIDIVTTQAGYYGIPRSVAIPEAEKNLKALGLWDKRNEPSQKLSGGMKRRLMIARALIHKPKLLILDEPTAGVDVEMRHEMWAFLRKINKEGTTIVLTTHYLEEAEQLCNNVAIINKGEIELNEPMRRLLERHGEAKLESIYLGLIKKEDASQQS
jgi:ABC-2 type transport system ATP-binding protein